MSNILLKNKENVITDIKYSDILDYLYFKLYNIPSPSEIETYNKKHHTDYQSEKIKEIISSIGTRLPLFDIISHNIYLISEELVYYYIKEKHYRLPNHDVLDFLNMLY